MNNDIIGNIFYILFYLEIIIIYCIHERHWNIIVSTNECEQ